MNVQLLAFVLGLATAQGCQGESDEPWPLEKRAQKANIVVKALMISKHLDPQRPEGYWAEFWLLDVYKGSDKLALTLGVARDPQEIYHLKDHRINVSDWGVASTCQSSPVIQKNYFIFLTTRRPLSSLPVQFRARYDGPAGAAEEFSVDKEQRLLKAIGWQPWQSWGPCSQTCGEGVQERVRLCETPSQCSGNDVERRTCNSFKCQNAVNTLDVEDAKYFKPSPRAFDRVSGRSAHAWTIKPGSYFLLPFRQIFGRDFPRDFTVFLTLRPAKETEGIIFSINARNSKQDYISLELNDGRLELIHSLTNGSKIIDIPARIADGEWHQLAISIDGGSSIRTYLDCHWISTQVVHKHNFNVADNADLIIGYMFQGEMDQLTVTDERSCVNQQCSATHVPIISRLQSKALKAKGQSLEPKGQAHFHHSTANDIHIDDDDDEDQRKGMRKKQKVSKAGDSSEEEEYMDLDDVESSNKISSTSDSWKIDIIEGSGGEAHGPVDDEGGDDDDDDTLEGSGESWSDWSDCTASCGSFGVQSRSKGASVESRSCQGPPCLFSGWIPVANSQKVREITSKHKAKAEVTGSCSCLNGGRCEEPGGLCRCTAEFEGAKCEKPRCRPAGCLNKGQCLAPDVCKCKDGFTGARCQIPFCYPSCENGGECVAPFHCKCPAGLEGRFCQNWTCQPSCTHGRVCVGPNRCQCPKGRTCGQVKVRSECKCINGGICSDQRCQCPKGFYGKRCEKRICKSYVAVKVPQKRSSSKKLFRTLYRCAER